MLFTKLWFSFMYVSIWTHVFFVEIKWQILVLQSFYISFTPLHDFIYFPYILYHFIHYVEFIINLSLLIFSFNNAKWFNILFQFSIILIKIRKKLENLLLNWNIYIALNIVLEYLIFIFLNHVNDIFKGHCMKHLPVFSSQQE